jgi:hypothetical protein
MIETVESISAVQSSDNPFRDFDALEELDKLFCDDIPTDPQEIIDNLLPLEG